MINFPPVTVGLDSWWVRCWEYEPLWIVFFWLFAAFWVGCCVGSFLNVCIWRLPHGESVVFAPSHCPRCNTPLQWYDNIPIWGFLHLRGKCRYCRQPIAVQYLAMELGVGVLFAAILAKVGWSEQSPLMLLPYGAMAMLCVTTFFIDMRYRIIPSATTWPGIIFGIATAFALPGTQGFAARLPGGIYSLLSAALTALFLTLFVVIGRRIAGRDVLGWGDVKFMTACAALLGIFGACLTLLTGSLTGMIYGTALAVRRGRKLSRTTIPLGPFLAIGALLWIFAGEKLLRFFLPPL